MANTKSAVPAIEAVAVPSKLTLGAEVVADIFGRTTAWSKAADKAEKAAVGLMDVLFAAGIKPDDLLAEKGDPDFIRGMGVAIVEGFDIKVQALLQHTDKLPEGTFDKANPVAYNNGTKRYHQGRIGSRFGDIRRGLEARYTLAAQAKVKAETEAMLKAQAEKTAKANAEAAKAAEADAMAKVKAAAAEAKAAKAKGSDKAALAAAAAKAAEAAALEAAAKAVADKAAAEAAALEAAAKAEAVARVEAEIATKLRDAFVATWKSQKEQAQKATKPSIPVPEVVAALDALIALVMVVKK